MRTISIAFIFVTLGLSFCNAQLSVNADWRERNGLTVASSQTVSVPASILRGFVVLESVDADPRNAVINVREKKKAAVAALNAIGVTEESIKMTATSILEWKTKTKYGSQFGSNSQALLPTTATQSCTAVAYMSFDIPVDGLKSDDLVLLPYDTCKNLQEQEVFESRKIYFLYVGKLKPSDIKNAHEKAYDEAFESAKSIAELSGRSLGKLAAMTPEMDGRWRYGSRLIYGQWNEPADGRNPLFEFSPSENEIFGNDPLDLSRSFSVELRFNIE